MSRFAKQPEDKDNCAWYLRLRFSVERETLREPELSELRSYLDAADKACQAEQRQESVDWGREQRRQEPAAPKAPVAAEPESIHQCKQRIKNIVAVLDSSERPIILAWLKAGMPDKASG